MRKKDKVITWINKNNTKKKKKKEKKTLILYLV